MQKIIPFFKTTGWAIGYPFVGLYLLILYLSVRLKSRKYKKYPDNFLAAERYAGVYKLSKLFKYIFRVKIDEFVDKEKISSKPQLIVCNHRSMIDSLLLFNFLYNQLSNNFIFVAKKELEGTKIGVILDYVDTLYLDRENIREGLKLIDKQKELIKNGNVVIVFPEGTRNNENELLEFKAGAFEVAYRAMCSIQPIVLTHTNEYKEDKKEYRKRKSKVQMSIMEELKPANFISIDRVVLAKNLQKKMQDKYNSMIKNTDKKK